MAKKSAEYSAKYREENRTELHRKDLERIAEIKLEGGKRYEAYLRNKANAYKKFRERLRTDPKYAEEYYKKLRGTSAKWKLENSEKARQGNLKYLADAKEAFSVQYIRNAARRKFKFNEKELPDVVVSKIYKYAEIYLKAVMTLKDGTKNV